MDAVCPFCAVNYSEGERGERVAAVFHVKYTMNTHKYIADVLVMIVEIIPVTTCK